MKNQDMHKMDKDQTDPITIVDLPGRLETGRLQNGSDWPGVFIRGDNALHFWHCLERRTRGPDVINEAVLDGLSDLLLSCKIEKAGVSRTHPGEHLKEYLDSYELSILELCKKAGVSIDAMTGLYKLEQPITQEIAEALEKVFARPAHFWLNLHRQYDEKKD